jgi:hypothetical protein
MAVLMQAICALKGDSMTITRRSDVLCDLTTRM